MMKITYEDVGQYMEYSENLIYIQCIKTTSYNWFDQVINYIKQREFLRNKSELGYKLYWKSRDATKEFEIGWYGDKQILNRFPKL